MAEELLDLPVRNDCGIEIGICANVQFVDVEGDGQSIGEEVVPSGLATFQFPESAIVIQSSAVDGDQVLELTCFRSSTVDAFDALKTHILIGHGLCAIFLNLFEIFGHRDVGACLNSNWDCCKSRPNHFGNTSNRSVATIDCLSKHHIL